jgi:MerR family transcriptional regulator, light-induced transcriptional regulator
VSVVGLLSVSEVAARLGVSTATVRSWERRHGIRPSTRTSGGHRRYTTGDLDLLLRARRLTASGISWPAALGLAGGSSAAVDVHDAPRGSAAARFVHAIDVLDGSGAASAVRQTLRRTGAAAAWTTLFAPYLRDLGQAWQRTATGVEREHLTTLVLQTELTRYANERNRGRSGLAVVLMAATEQERHVLPLHALHAALADSGVVGCVIGQVPTSALIDAAADLSPRIVVLWSRGRHAGNAAQLRASAAAVPLVCAAGPGWSPGRLPAGVPHLADLPTALEIIEVWTR